jgi:hypothetical protein
MDEIERAAIRDEGYDPDDPEVVAALDRVRDELGGFRFEHSLFALPRTIPRMKISAGGRARGGLYVAN